MAAGLAGVAAAGSRAGGSVGLDWLKGLADDAFKKTQKTSDDDLELARRRKRAFDR